jgi:hypothetical protein
LSFRYNSLEVWDFIHRSSVSLLRGAFGISFTVVKTDPDDLASWPINAIINRVEQRIAQIALFIENNDPGRKLFTARKGNPHKKPNGMRFINRYRGELTI